MNTRRQIWRIPTIIIIAILIGEDLFAKCHKNVTLWRVTKYREWRYLSLFCPPNKHFAVVTVAITRQLSYLFSEQEIYIFSWHPFYLFCFVLFYFSCLYMVFKIGVFWGDTEKRIVGLNLGVKKMSNWQQIHYFQLGKSFIQNLVWQLAVLFANMVIAELNNWCNYFSINFADTIWMQCKIM